MALKPYRFVGLARDVWIPDDIKVDIRIVSHPNVRSYQTFTGQTEGTVHDTGNDETRAEGEYKWLADGRPGGEAGGYNFIYDSNIIIQTVPLNEVTWHAGTPEGNKSWGSEMAYGGGQDFDRLIYVTAALWGGLCAAMGWDVDKAMVLHQHWYGKYCSRQILNRKAWPRVQQAIKDAKSRAVAAAGGTLPVPTPDTSALTYPTGMDKGIAARQFGTVKGYGFDENGPVSQLWLAQGKESKRFPALTDVWVYENGARKYFWFSDGSCIWHGKGDAVRYLG